MVIPFGVGVGDFIAVGKLIKQIVAELQGTGEAAPTYQDLILELEAIGRALSQLESLQPVHHELFQLTAIRAMVATCKRPLEEFLSKIQKFDRRLGVFGAKENRITGLLRRLQFSLMYKDDIRELRSKLSSHLRITNVRLTTQAVISLMEASGERKRIECGLHSQILASQRLIEDVKGHAEVSLENQLETKMHLRDQSAVLERLEGKADHANENLESQGAVLRAVQATVTNSQAQTTSILTTATDILALVTPGVANLQLSIRDLLKIPELYTRFMDDMRESMSKLLTLLSGMSDGVQRIEAVLQRGPSLPIIKFTDALGETIALPYQLCQEWSTFKDLMGLVFKKKQGKFRVDAGQYLIMNARGGRLLQKASWKHAVRQDDHLSMSMILSEITASDGFCPFPTCRASLSAVQVKNGGRTCLECGRWAVRVPRTHRRSRLRGINRNLDDDEGMSGCDEMLRRLSKEKLFDQKAGKNPEEDEENIEAYRQVHVQAAGTLIDILIENPRPPPGYPIRGEWPRNLETSSKLLILKDAFLTFQQGVKANNPTPKKSMAKSMAKSLQYAAMKHYLKSLQHEAILKVLIPKTIGDQL
ncbi:hypothetical protein V492_04776 [Pseudogymnoascus sp. VKM F-4246]|nr:hypothetical protein V492_04776 [Pseudogymnoascus sp. VKM F-4246]